MTMDVVSAKMGERNLSRNFAKKKSCELKENVKVLVTVELSNLHSPAISICSFNYAPKSFSLARLIFSLSRKSPHENYRTERATTSSVERGIIETSIKNPI